jgi:hypothetical protein
MGDKACRPARCPDADACGPATGNPAHGVAKRAFPTIMISLDNTSLLSRPSTAALDHGPTDGLLPDPGESRDTSTGT